LFDVNILASRFFDFQKTLYLVDKLIWCSFFNV